MNEIEAREVYRTSLQMIPMIAKINADTFRLALAANAFLVTAIAVIEHYAPQARWLPSLLAWLGIMFCFSWILITSRHSDYGKYWYAKARECERVLYSAFTGPVTQGARFAHGETCGQGAEEIRMRWGSRLFKAEWLTYVGILAFLILYLCLLFGLTP